MITIITPGESLGTCAYEQLRDAILSSELPPGTRLSIPELARKLGISRSPVREAVLRLIHEGLASHEANRGAVVAVVDVDDLEQLYQVREVLEGLAARLATINVDVSTLSELRKLVDEHEHLVEARADESTHTRLDMRLHRKIRELSGNSHLCAILDGIQGKSHLAMHSLWRAEGAKTALDEHRRVVDAIAKGDAEGADRAAREHVARLRKVLAGVASTRAEGPSDANEDVA